jgi:hypothetical protein
MNYIPSPIPVKYEYAYTATANKSGRMQYHKIKPGHHKIRISRAEFIKAYNELPLIAIKPIPMTGDENAFQLEFYI